MRGRHSFFSIMIPFLKKIKFIFLTSLVVLLLFFTAFALLGPFSKISLIDFKAGYRLKNTQSYIKREKEILSYLNSQKGRLLWSLDLKGTAHKINSIYSGAEVYIRRRFPGRLIVSLRKKDTALLLLRDGESLYSVSYEGEIGLKRGMGESFDFPILRGPLFWSERRLREKALAILSVIPKEGAAFSVQNVSEISYNRANDSLLLYLIPDSLVLELTDPPEPEKIKNIDFVIRYLSQKGIQRSRVDARLSKKIIVKNRD